MKLWQQCRAAGSPEAPFNDLVKRYPEPQRAYHNLQHIAECLAELDDCDADTATEMAIWFHDAVYDSTKGNNEERSAELAAKVLKKAKIDARFIQRVELLVMATKHGHQRETKATATIIGADLAILGQPRQRFDEYDAAIRKEYAWVPADKYRSGRAAVLNKFLQRRYIYTSEHFRAKYEKKARANLARAIKRLMTG